MNSTILSCESGRSMVEMLGVLAIIGVLSVGGIAGYTTAMRSHRANEIVNATSMLYMMGISSNGGEGNQTMSYDISGLPSEVTSLVYNPNSTITLQIKGKNLCGVVKNKLGDKIAGDCKNDSLESFLLVTLGEVKTGPLKTLAEAISDGCDSSSSTQIGNCPEGIRSIDSSYGELVAACSDGCTSEIAQQIEDILHSNGDERNCTIVTRQVICGNYY